MKIILTVFLLLLFFFSSEIYTQEQTILIYDPYDVSGSFQSSLSILSDDSVFNTNAIDETIYNYDALFLFLGYPYELNQEEGNHLINYLQNKKPVYLYTELGLARTDSVNFWNFIGLEFYISLTITVPVDSVIGVESEFTNSVIIYSSFWSPGVPAVQGNLTSILIGEGDSFEIDVSYISGYDSLKIIVDQYFQIHHVEFLEKVLAYFELNESAEDNLEFYPPVDTAIILSGCTTPEIFCYNLISNSIRDSISIEPGSNVSFFYDSLGYPVYVENYYFIARDSSDELEYELWLHPKTFPPFEPVLIPFDSTFYTDQNEFDIQLLAKRNDITIDSLSQPFRAYYGLNVEDENILLSDYSLSQNYPNPFNPTTKIKFTIPTSPLNPSPYQKEGNRERFVTLIVYDVLGNEIATLVNEQKPAGSYEVEFSATGGATDLTSGVYFYRLRVGNYVEVKKMVLIK
jgi:hypothetical protein